jgi:hypothetical protein
MRLTPAKTAKLMLLSSHSLWKLMVNTMEMMTAMMTQLDQLEMLQLQMPTQLDQLEMLQLQMPTLPSQLPTQLDQLEMLQLQMLRSNPPEHKVSVTLSY